MHVPCMTSANFVSVPFLQSGDKSSSPHPCFALPGFGGQNLFGLNDHKKHAPFGFQSYRRRLGPTSNIHLIIIIC